MTLFILGFTAGAICTKVFKVFFDDSEEEKEFEIRNDMLLQKFMQNKKAK